MTIPRPSDTGERGCLACCPHHIERGQQAPARDRAAVEVRALILAGGGNVCTADVLDLPTIRDALEALDGTPR